MKITITGKNGTQEYDFDENSILLTDERERIFKENGKWYITKLIGNDFTKWVEETQPTIIEDKKIEKIKTKIGYGGLTYLEDENFSDGDLGFKKRENVIVDKINEIIDYIQEK